MNCRKVLAVFLILWAAILLPMLALDAWICFRRSHASQIQGILNAPSWRKEFLNASTLPLIESIGSAAAAKREKLFWPALELAAPPPYLSDRRSFGIQIGAGIDVLHQQGLVDEIFPGYRKHHPDFLSHQRLWNRYFSSAFNSKTWAPSLSHSPFGAYALYIPWKGCLAIWNVYGADVLLLGTSETYRSLIPAHLASSSQRVLSCATGGLRPREQEWLIQELIQAKKPRAKRILWGLSYWTLRPEALHQAPRSEIFHTEPPSWQEAGLHTQMSAFSFPRWKEAQALWQDPEWKIWLRTQKEYWQQDGSLILKKGSLHSTETQLDIETLFQKRLQASMNHACELSTESKAYIARTLDHLQGLAEEVIVFLPPTLPVFRADEPSCFHHSLTNWLLSQQTKQIRFYQSKEGTFSSDDFLYATWSKDLSYLNTNHLNYEGAVKFTGLLNQTLGKKP